MTINIQDGGSYFTPMGNFQTVSLSNPITVGTVFNLPEVADNVYRILQISASQTIPDVNLFVDGQPLINNATGGRLVRSSNTPSSVNDFFLSCTFTDSSIGSNGRIIKEIFCKSFSIEKYTSDAVSSITLVYITGSINKVK